MNDVLDMKKRDHLRSIFLLTTILGIIVTAIGVILSFKFIYLDIKDKKSVKAEVISQSGMNINVRYEINNKLYKNKLFVFTKKFINGEKVKVYYNPTNPYKAQFSSTRYYSLLVPVIGLIIQGISGIGFIYIYMKYYNKYRPLFVE